MTRFYFGILVTLAPKAKHNSLYGTLDIGFR